MVKEKNLDNEDEYFVKVADLPYKIGTTIAELEHDEDYAFTSFPMPYNIKVKAKGAGTKEVEYTVVASPNRTEVPPDILLKLAKLKQIPELISREKELQKEKHVADGSFGREQERKARLQAEINQRRGLEDTAQPPVEDPKAKSVLPEYPEYPADPYADIAPEDRPF